MDNDIGFMQVHIRIYKYGEVYDSFAVNGFEQKYKVQTDKSTAEFQILRDAGEVEGFALSLLINFNEDGCSAALLIPVHESSEWEVVKPLDEYTIGFFCILGELA